MSVTRKTILVDADGVLADLVGGMRRFVNQTYGHDFDPNDVVFHNRMGRSPKLSDLDQKLREYFPVEADEEYNGFGGAFRCFMKDRDVYGRWIDPIPGAVETIAALRTSYDVVVVTAMMKSARDHYRSKMEWLERWFPAVPIITADASQKFRVTGDYAIDDRYDTCQRWWTAGVDARVFRQPWNEIPVGLIGVETWDWNKLKEDLLNDNEEA